MKDSQLMKLDRSVNKILDNYFKFMVVSDLFTVLPLPYFLIFLFRTLSHD